MKSIRKMAKKRRFKFKVSIFYILMVAVMALLGLGYEIIVYTVAVILHELAHAEIAERHGYALISFKLMPYGASLTGGFEGVRLRDEIIIALAGPLFNLCLTIPAVALWWLMPISYYATKAFVSANLFIAIFNLLPVFPLDGGRILLAFLSQKKPRQRAYAAVRIISYCFAGVMAVLFVLSMIYGVNFSFATVAIFIFVSSVIPDKNSYYQRLYSMAFRSEKLKRGLYVREIMVDADSTVLKLTKMLSGSYYTRFVLVGTDMKALATVSETELEELSLKISLNEPVLNGKKIIF